MEDRVTLINRPVSNVSGQHIGFSKSLPQDNTGGWSVQFSTDGHLVSTTIDEALAALQLTGPYIMKIDIEGFEPFALQGAVRSLRRTLVIFMEWGGGGPEKTKMALGLVRMGFTVNDADCEKSGYVRCPWDIVGKEMF